MMVGDESDNLMKRLESPMPEDNKMTNVFATYSDKGDSRRQIGGEKTRNDKHGKR